MGGPQGVGGGGGITPKLGEQCRLAFRQSNRSAGVSSAPHSCQASPPIVGHVTDVLCDNAATTHVPHAPTHLGESLGRQRAALEGLCVWGGGGERGAGIGVALISADARTIIHGMAAAWDGTGGYVRAARSR